MDIAPEIIGLIDEIAEDRVHGASHLARQAVLVLKQTAGMSRAGNAGAFLYEQKQIGGRLMVVRPAMAPVFNLVSRLLDEVSEKAGEAGLDSVREFTVDRAAELIEESLAAVTRIAAYGAGLLAGGDRVMTHSYSSTVVAALEAAFTRYGDIQVVATRSGPGRTGEQLARELGSYGMPVTFIDDVGMGLYMSSVNKVMVGADRICADGGLINGIGSYQVAVVARKMGVPFYVLGETLKFDPRLTSDSVDLEEKEASEVAVPGGLPASVKVRNPYFDVTPLELVTGFITENGLLNHADVISYLEAGHK